MMPVYASVYLWCAIISEKVVHDDSRSEGSVIFFLPLDYFLSAVSSIFCCRVHALTLSRTHSECARFCSQSYFVVLARTWNNTRARAHMVGQVACVEKCVDRQAATLQ